MQLLKHFRPGTRSLIYSGNYNCLFQNMASKMKSEDDDDEVDFMSDEFLAQCTKNDVRPGLLMKPSDKRRHELLKKQSESNQKTKTQNKSMRQIEEETREKTLNTEIGSDNKGFLLMQKMGYKAGTSIGKSDAEYNQDALKKPIQIVLKRDRLGLGEKSKAEKKKQKMNEWKEHLEQLADPSEYRARIQTSKSNQLMVRDLKNAQSCCQTLDMRDGQTEPDQPWFWPHIPKAKAKAAEKSRGIGEAEDSDDESQEDPTLTREVQDDLEDSESEESIEEEDDVPINEKLTQLVSYLRDKHLYCIWCGAAYDSAEELEQNCPGTRDEH